MFDTKNIVLEMMHSTFNIDWFEQGLLLVVSLLANALSAMAGGGAGLVQLPALILMGLPFSAALVTHKIASVALGMGASIKHSRSGLIDWRLALMILLSGLPGVFVGAKLILSVPELSAQIALGILTIAMGLYSILQKKLGQTYLPKNRDFQGFVIGGAVLFIIGVINGSLTSGTGSFVTLWLITWFGMDYQRATAYTMILVGLFWNGTGALTLALLTPAHWSWLPMLIIGSFVGGYWGARIAVAKGNLFIKRLFEAVTLLMGTSLIVHAFK